jgi:hypothetical protein
MADIDSILHQPQVRGGVVKVPGDPSIFNDDVTLLGADRNGYFDDALMNKMIWYVLYNCEEVDDYRE